MHYIRKRIEKFCYKHPNFGIPRLMLIIIVGMAACYVISMMDRTGTFFSYLVFRPDLILRGQVWRLLSWLLIPQSSRFWVFVELYFYYFLAGTLEGTWGSGRFTCFYFLGVLFSVVFGFLIYFITGNPYYGSFTPYYLNMSMFFAFATLYPEQRMLLIFIIPIKVKWLAIFDAVVIFAPAILAGLSGYWYVLLLPLAAVLNYIFFCWPEIERVLNFKRAQTNTIPFKQAARQYQRQQAKTKENYRRKCAVCGRTDTDYPQLEFRFCSRCQGYHCFCS
ncbi:MAG: hypothetical protein MJ075_04740, partial [Oscillospiraceae bacterium]|nr:hypothetical protein [Oscillospiraceae bacterium]